MQGTLSLQGRPFFSRFPSLVPRHLHSSKVVAIAIKALALVSAALFLIYCAYKFAAWISPQPKAPGPDVLSPGAPPTSVPLEPTPDAGVPPLERMSPPADQPTVKKPLAPSLPILQTNHDHTEFKINPGILGRLGIQVTDPAAALQFLYGLSREQRTAFFRSLAHPSDCSHQIMRPLALDPPPETPATAAVAPIALPELTAADVEPAHLDTKDTIQKADPQRQTFTYNDIPFKILGRKKMPYWIQNNTQVTLTKLPSTSGQEQYQVTCTKRTKKGLVQQAHCVRVNSAPSETVR